MNEKGSDVFNQQFLPLITLYPIAVGNENTVIQMSFHGSNMGGSSATEYNSIFGKGTSISVPSKTLNTVLHDFTSPIIFAKIDVEGYEPYVIEGASDLLKNQQIKIIYYEKTCHITKINKDVFSKIDILFKKYNYTTSNSECRHESDQFNVLAIASSYITETQIDINELINSRY